MGKIMMNGIQYGVGGIEQAKDISYDNTESGATATDVQGALDELNAGLADITGFDDTISPTAWPFTCPADGMFFAGIIPTQSGDAYAYYTKNGNFFLSISSHSGLQQSACAPVRKGDVINRAGSSNASNRGWLEPFKSSN